MSDNFNEELDYEIDFLVKTGFYDKEEILETIDDEFIDYDIDLDEVSNIIEDIYTKHNTKSNSSDFNNLKEAFISLSKQGIVSAHNCGYDPEEGIHDSIEVYTHLINNDYKPQGFVFYTLYDIENVLDNGSLNIYFGDFHGNKKSSKKLAKIIIETLESFKFKVSWDNNPENPIVIEDFNWVKVFDDSDYFMEGAYEDFTKFNNN
ncbi:hypothetical protein BGI41_04665 [Methanobrevibacter sp. 87.7]|uniref:DUF6891 domain-containing protein n=1 Tax=Methanobrevibacter sp. 87.7 TaxID=387957 RepID=UPI000B4FDDE9|nr:hypothetical protein [Methanobrevibacter sp. 87.7]OWT33001.1 hypothetical protein BGI41_04665 [Methanobrevibacter sp. 87.7]